MEFRSWGKFKRARKTALSPAPLSGPIGGLLFCRRGCWLSSRYARLGRRCGNGCRCRASCRRREHKCARVCTRRDFRRWLGFFTCGLRGFVIVGRGGFDGLAKLEGGYFVAMCRFRGSFSRFELGLFCEHGRRQFSKGCTRQQGRCGDEKDLLFHEGESPDNFKLALQRPQRCRWIWLAYAALGFCRQQYRLPRARDAL
jgi:hypothetical protein